MRLKYFRVVDRPLFVLAIIASLLGAAFIFDAGYVRSLRMDHRVFPREAQMQLIYLGVSVVLAGLVGAVAPEKWRKWAVPTFLFSMATLMALEFVPGLGVTRNGATRWIKLGPFEIQPAEFAKVAAILYLAAVFAAWKPWKPSQKINSFKSWIRKAALPKMIRLIPAFAILLMVVLIEMEPDLGTAAVVAATAYVMFILGGAHRTTLIVGLAIAFLGASFLVWKQPYRWERIDKHLHRWTMENMDDIGYQTVQAETAMASGGLFGVGVGSGRAKHLLPAATTDFIPATIGEETGMWGMALVLGVLAAICLRLLALAQRASTPFAALLLSGVACWIGVQAIVNVSMANGLFPAIGIPLPFISYGGSSLLALWLALGLCQSVLVPVASARAVVSMEEKGAANRGDRWRDGRTRLSRT